MGYSTHYIVLVVVSARMEGSRIANSKLPSLNDPDGRHNIGVLGTTVLQPARKHRRR